jgi:hypothetical protein
VTANPEGIVYISDSKTGKIHQYKDGKTTVFLEKINRPNGLLSLCSDLWVLASGELFKVKSNKEMEKIAIGMEMTKKMSWRINIATDEPLVSSE